MDIVELSRKMEANLLESHSNKTDVDQFLSESFSPRVTRSQTSKGQKQTLTKDCEVNVQQKQSLRKVDEVEKIYLNQKTKVVHKNLETIYEDPIWKKGSTMLLGTSKVKRCIYLDREFRIKSKQKSKLRKMKIKRLGKRLKPPKMSDEEFKNKMLRIENYINGDDVEIECKSGNCDVEFYNCKEDEKVNDIDNIDSSGSDSSRSKDSELGELVPSSGVLG